VLTADRILPELEEIDDRRSSLQSRKAAPGHDIYEVDAAALRSSRRTVPPRPIAPVPQVEEPAEPAGFQLSMPVLAGGAIGLVVVSMLSVWLVMSLAKTREPVVVASAVPEPSATPPAVAEPEPAAKAEPAESAAPDSTPEPAPTPAATQPDPAPQAAAAEPAEPTEISVADLLGLAPSTSRPQPNIRPRAIVPAPPPAVAPASAPSIVLEPEPTTDSDLIRQARAGAASIATRDDGAGKTLSTADIVEESEPSVALVKGNNSSGTGFLVAPGLLATNSHVIDDEFISDLEIRFVSADDARKAPLKAELLYEDPERDLAFLAVKTDLKPLRVARTYNFRKGEDVTVIGSPGLGDGQVLENAISRGVMSTKTQIDNRNFYQLGIAINPGNSGGPVFDSSGRVIGVATLKSAKQESTGFCIPIEDLQTAIAKVSTQTNGESNQYRSRHRMLVEVKGLGSGGALMCLIIDLRRAEAMTHAAEVKDLLAKLEPIVAELDKELVPTLTANASRIKNDQLVASPVKRMVGEMSDNLTRIRGVYASRRPGDDNQLRSWKQTHRQLLTNLASTLKLDIPAGLLTAFDDHAPAQTTTITMAPSNLGSFGSRLRPRTPASPARPPSPRDRARGRIGR
jgi:S1-C subfamily serine protease